MAFNLYILPCVDYSYYVGHTDDLERRIAQHHAGEIPGYTHGRRPLRLVYAQDFPTRIEALTTERQLKGWSRAKKEALILQKWERLRHLAGKHTKTPGQAPGRSPSTRPFGVGSGRTDRGAGLVRPWTCTEILASELQMRGWSRATKEALILQNWERLHQLSNKRTKTSPPTPARSPSTRPCGVGSGRTDRGVGL